MPREAAKNLPGSLVEKEVNKMKRKTAYHHQRLVIVVFSLLLLIFMPIACREDKAETAGEAISIQTGVIGGASDGPAAGPFTNSKGWTVELTKAEMAVGPIYFYSSAPLAGLWKRIFSPSVAYACPAHAQYDKGAVLGEVLQQCVVDLLSDQITDTGASDGQKGHCRMFELHIHPPGEIEAGSPQSQFDGLNGYSVWVEGSAEKDGGTIEFEGGLTIPDEGTMRIVENISADMNLSDGSSAVVRVLVDAWFTNVDFASLTEIGQSGRYTITEDIQAHTALLSGVRSRYSYEAYTE